MVLDELRIGVVLEPFADTRLDDVLGWLAGEVPEVTHIEVGAGGYAPHPHCDVAGLLSSRSARTRWLDQIARHGLAVDALNVWGNPLHPDPDLAARHDEDLRNAIRLAALLGVDRIVAMAGCPSAAPGDRTPHFGAGGWLPYLEGVWERQWERWVAPYWSSLAAFATAEHPGLLVCLELHPGTVAFNVETFSRVAALGDCIAANLDPSHFFWMGMDGHKVTAAILDRVGHAHGKDVVFHAENLALNGLLDRRWPSPPEQMPWTFAVPGRGHDLGWWTELARLLARSPARVISIEHEDPFVSPREGVARAARLLSAAISASKAGGAAHGEPAGGATRAGPTGGGRRATQPGGNRAEAAS